MSRRSASSAHEPGSKCGDLRPPVDSFRIDQIVGELLGPADIGKLDQAPFREIARNDRSRRLCDLPEGIAHRRQITLARLGQKYAPIDPLEKYDPEGSLERLEQLTDRPRGHAQLIGGSFHREVARGGFEGAQRIERWQAMCHLEFLTRWSD